MRSIDKSLTIQLLSLREAVLERFRPHLRQGGVSEQQWRILRVLNELKEGGQRNAPIKTLCQTSLISPSSLSRLIKKMEQRGIIGLTPSANDRRSMNVSLTPAGSKLFAKMSLDSESIYTDVEGILGKREIASLIATIKEMRATLDQATQAKKP